MSNLDIIRGDIYNSEVSFNAALIDDAVSFQREAGYAMQLMSNNNYLATAAMNNRQALVDAIVNLAAIGLTLNPASKHAYLVPRDGRVCLDISYMGLIDLATKSGSIMWAKAELVHEKDEFILHDADQLPTHNRNPFADRGLVVGAYCVAKLSNGDYMTEAMSKAALDEIKNRSKSYNSKKGPSGPWVTDEGEMQRKTVIKRASKYWPTSDRLNNAVEVLNNHSGEGVIIDEAPRMSDQRIAEMKALAASANDAQELQGLWRQFSVEMQTTANIAQYNEVKAVVVETLDELRAIPTTVTGQGEVINHD